MRGEGDRCAVRKDRQVLGRRLARARARTRLKALVFVVWRVRICASLNSPIGVCCTSSGKLVQPKSDDEEPEVPTEKARSYYNSELKLAL